MIFRLTGVLFRLTGVLFRLTGGSLHVILSKCPRAHSSIPSHKHERAEKRARSMLGTEINNQLLSAASTCTLYPLLRRGSAEKSECRRKRLHLLHSADMQNTPSSLCGNLVPRVLWLFRQRRQQRLWGIRKKLNFLIGCPATASIVLPQKSCGNKIPVLQSLYWRPSADQKARGLWVRDCLCGGKSTL